MRKLLVLVTVALATAPTADAGVRIVPSLTPKATRALWRAEVARSRTTRTLADASCNPAHVVFYAQTDWLRLATKLAAQPSPCADYSVSVPPLAADKTQARSGQASQIRALGASFHALDEVSWNGWSAWVAAGNGSWYDAGLAARQRMAAAGFDANAGDTWAVNELSSAVRTGTGVARQNALEFLRGLASDGVKGVVFVQGIGQSTADTTTYKLALQSWLEDDAFWSAASGYVSDWAQEDYGDLRTYAVADTTADARRDQEVQYLGHPLALAHAGPASTATARSFLDSAYVAFGNAAWAWPSAYGWTAAPIANMEDFVSGQVYASRSLGAPSGVDRFGFAWSPSNTLGLSDADFTAQTGALLDRLAGAIRDSGASGADACAPAWCTTALDGATFTTAGQWFSTWSPTTVVFTSPPASFTAGSSTAVTVGLQAAGVAQTADSAQTVTFSSSSAAGSFSPSATVTIPAGASSATVTYADTQPGTPAVSATLAGQAPVTQVETVTAPASPPPPPPPTGGPPPPPPPAPTPAPAPPSPPTPVVTPKPVPPAARVFLRRVNGHLVAKVVVEPHARVVVALRVRRGSSTVAALTRRTTTAGTFTWRSRHRLPKGRYVARAIVRSASTA
ncbi:MAG TPA: hypothetical protein VFJ93_12610 [Gaiellaceae bacterium]|nr:hypothetical protein [Gaiellaceae bacterium]